MPGHWEEDLVFGSGSSQIATLVERQTRYGMLVKLEGKDSQTIVKALIKNARKLTQELYKTRARLQPNGGFQPRDSAVSTH